MNRLEEALAGAQQRHGLVGMGAAVAVDGDVVASAVAGKTHRRGTAPNLNDRWHIGSVTKPMTATLIGLLCDEGRFDLDAALFDVLPTLQADADPLWGQVTMRHLLSHVHGGPANLPMRSQLSRASSATELLSERRALLASMLHKPPASPAGTEFLYSNFGYVLAAHVAEQLFEQSYEQLMRERIFGPLGMDSAGFGAPAGQELCGHKRAFRRNIAMRPTARADNGPLMSAAGRAHMSLTDLLAFGDDFRRSLDGQTDALLTPATAAELTKLAFPGVSETYASGWIVERLANDRGVMFWHNGSNTFWVAQLLVLVDEATVIALATNVGMFHRAERAFADVATAFLRG